MEKNYSYKINKILSAMLIWELIFWSLLLSFLFMMDFFSNSSSDNHLAFKNPENFSAIYIILPLFIGVNCWYLYWKNKKLASLGKINTLQTLLKPLNSGRYFISYFLLRNALVFLLIAAAQPVFGSKKVKGTRDSMELVLAIDVSNSMNTRDIDSETSRLEIVKRAMIQLINNLHGEKIGVCVFAGSAYIQLPITGDYEAAKMYVNEIETSMLSNQGTDIASAMLVSAEMFSKEKTSKAILVVSDGENHEGNVDEAVAKVKESNILLAVLGIGTKSGGFVPTDPLRPELGYKVDAKGGRIISKMNENLMHQVANKAGGFAVISSSAYPDLSELIKELGNLKRTKIDGIELNIKENWYQTPLLFGILFFISYSLFRQGMNFGRNKLA
jgi:Ca-activated chloride channel family protein